MENACCQSPLGQLVPASGSTYLRALKMFVLISVDSGLE